MSVPLPFGRALRAALLSRVIARLCNLFWAIIGTSAFPAGGVQVQRLCARSSGDPALCAGDRECEVALRASVQRLTREELALGLLRLLADLEAEARPTLERNFWYIGKDDALGHLCHALLLILPAPGPFSCLLSLVGSGCTPSLSGNPRCVKDQSSSAC